MNTKRLYLFLPLLLALILGSVGCSKDDATDVDPTDEAYESNPTTLNGTWHMISASYGLGGVKSYQSGEITVTFNEAEKTMKVDDKKNIEFLKSGDYPYEITNEKSSILSKGQWIDVDNQVIVIHYNDEGHNRENKYIYQFYNGMLVLDGGISCDGPGYFLKKLK